LAILAFLSERRFFSRVGPGNARKTCACVACAACLPRFVCELWKALANAEVGRKSLSHAKDAKASINREKNSEESSLCDLVSCLCVSACRQTLSEHI